MAYTPAEKDIIRRAMGEWSDSKVRTEAEADQRKGIKDRIKKTTSMDPKVFAKIADLHHKQGKEAFEGEVDDILAGYDEVMGAIESA